MAKMSRGDLKSLVKECLFEILLEATEESGVMAESKRKKAPRRDRSSSRRPALDMMSMNNKKPTPKPKKNFDVSELTSDPVMAAIFQDTAATTLVEQASAERRPGHATASTMDTAAKTVSQNDPSELFGAASKNWATLAFDK